jgi:hypothetical protein
MVMLGMVNMLLLLIGFLPALRKKSGEVNRGMAGDPGMQRAAH